METLLIRLSFKFLIKKFFGLKMDQIIGEHFSSLESFRSLSLIFDLEVPFVKSLIFEIKAFQKEGIYLNGKHKGRWILWFGNGQKALEGNYRNGLREGSGAYGEAGLWITWHPNGQKESEGNYRNGKEEGLWIIWWNNGQKRSERNYRNGKQEGLWVSWYENGQKRIEGNYRNGLKEKLWILWCENGQKRREENYVNGKRLSFKFPDR